TLITPRSQPPSSVRGLESADSPPPSTARRRPAPCPAQSPAAVPACDWTADDHRSSAVRSGWRAAALSPAPGAGLQTSPPPPAGPHLAQETRCPLAHDNDPHST